MATVNMNFGSYRNDPNIIVEGGKSTRDITFLHLSVPEGYQIDSIEFERRAGYSWYSLGVRTPETHPEFFINNNRTYYQVFTQYEDGDIWRIKNIEYSSTVKMYEVIFVNGDETRVLKVEQVVEGGSATPPPLPTDEVGRLYTGWDKPYDNIVADVTIKGVFEYTERTVTFLQTDADVESDPTFKIIPIYGTLGTLPTDPIRNGYEFKGWFTSDGVKATPDLIITEDITFHPSWEEIVPVAVGGNQVNCSAVIMGSNLIVTADEGFKFIDRIHILSASSTGNLFNQYFNPTKDSQYFSNGDTIFTLPVSEIRYSSFEVNATATNIDDIVYWTVIFKDYDGTILKEEQVIDGGDATPPEVPIRDGYVFIGWDKSYTNVTEDLVITAQYELKKCLVKFIDNGVVVEERYVEYNNVLGSLPNELEKEGYELIGWFSDGVEATPDLIITEDITFKSFWVLIVPVGGNQVNCTAVIKGNKLVVTADEGYRFTDTITVYSEDTVDDLYFVQYYDPVDNPQYFSNENTVFTLPTAEIMYLLKIMVHATATKIDDTVYWTVIFKDYDGTVLKEEQVIEGEDATPPEVPIREGYDFIGWDKSYTNVTEDLVIIAQYELVDDTLEKCLVKFIDNDVVVEERYVVLNDVIGILPNSLGKEGYEFIGWAIEGELIDENYVVTSDLIVTAMYELAKPLTGDYLVNARATLYSEYIKLEADEGYDFKESIEIIAVNNFGSIFYTYFSPTDDVNDVFNDERTVAIIPIELIKKPRDGRISYYVNAIATPIEYEEDLTTTFVNIYRVDKDLLNEIAGLRWDGSFDYGNFITSLYQLPIDIPEDKISEKKVAVQFGSHRTSVRVNTITATKLEVDLGEITVNPIYNNVFDYRDTRCFIHLPYLEPIELDINHVMDATIKVLLVVDLYTGYSTINVYTDKLEGVLIRKRIELTRDIPYIRSDLARNVVSETGYYIKNDLTRPYIELLRGKPIDNGDGVFGRPNDIVDRIGNHTGYLEVDKVLLNTSATNVEQSEIKRLLASGVYIE